MCTKIYVQNTGKNKYEGFDDILFHFLFLGVGWGWGSGSETLLFGKIVTLLKAHLLYITFIILYVFIIITIIINMYMHYKPWNLDGVARILGFFF